MIENEHIFGPTKLQFQNAQTQYGNSKVGIAHIVGTFTYNKFFQIYQRKKEIRSMIL